MSKVKPKSKKQAKIIKSPFNNYWNKNNYVILGFGIGIIILGFILMAQSPWDNPLSLSYSPIILLIAYLIVFPLSILYKSKKNKMDNDVSREN
jgi:hypothetical protein